MRPLGTRLTRASAKRRIRQILESGSVSLTKHAEKEMAHDDLTLVDCINVLRGGVIEPGQLIHGTWRYPVRTTRICVVVAFRSESELTVVTAWRLSK